MGSNKIDAVFRQPAGTVGHALAQLAEDQWFNRKSILAKPKDLARHLIAFANAEGGIFVVGIHDGTVQGVADYASNVSALRQSPLDFTNPPVRAAFEEVACVDEKGRPKPPPSHTSRAGRAGPRGLRQRMLSVRKGSPVPCTSSMNLALPSRQPRA